MIANGYEIRRATQDEIMCLPAIEQAAGTLFNAYRRETGLTDNLLSRVNSPETFERARKTDRLWIAVAPGAAVIGVALVLELGGYAHLEELDVLPTHGRRGIGTALVDAVCTWAGTSGYPGVTLRTFRNVPWNRPFYERRGFQVLRSSELSAAHVELEASEQRLGLRTDLRVSMLCPTAG